MPALAIEPAGLYTYVFAAIVTDRLCFRHDVFRFLTSYGGVL